jgi:hypothetical protein
MVRSQQHLQSERQDLLQQTAALSTTLTAQYQAYYQALGISSQKQMIIAAYQICTQIYPESFLKLTFNQRDKLQAHLRELSLAIGKQLQDALQQAQSSLSSPEATDSAIASIPSLTPESILVWCKQREKEMIRVLEAVSQSANQLLQQYHIIPSQLPPQLLEIAMKAEGEHSGQVANILDLLVEARSADNEEDEENQSDRLSLPQTKITAIHLRLSEIEFNDGQLTLLHKEIYQSLEQLSQLHQRYQHNQRELAIAGAEAAWRSSWREES